MLEKISVEQLNFLKYAEGPSKEMICIEEMKIGDLIRVITESGNIYFFEVSNPRKRLAHVFRCDQRLFAPLSGYRGIRTLQDISLGKQVFHDNSRTSAVKEINLV